jgi:hypothetical protein
MRSTAVRLEKFLLHLMILRTNGCEEIISFFGGIDIAIGRMIVNNHSKQKKW